MLPKGIAMSSVVSGDSTTWIRTHARFVPRPVIMSFAPGNGWWYDWASVTTDPAQWVAAWNVW
jgi:hypothetical protein